jgi:hypothetical protein
MDDGLYWQISEKIKAAVTAGSTTIFSIRGSDD